MRDVIRIQNYGKKFGSNRPWLISPTAFALAACGGGGGGSKTQPNVIFFDTPDDELIGLMTHNSKFSYSDDNPITFAIKIEDVGLPKFSDKEYNL